MNSFERLLHEKLNERYNTNINISVMALKSLYEELTDEQKKANSEKFVIILNGIIN